MKEVGKAVSMPGTPAWTMAVFPAKEVMEGTVLYTLPEMVDMVPPATSRDKWMYEQGRLAERAAKEKS